MSVGFGEGEIELPLFAGDGSLAQADDGRAGFEVGLGHLQRRLFQEQAVEKHQVGVGQRGGNGRGRLKGMRVDAFGHHPLQADAGAADVFDDAGDGRHRSNYVQAGRLRLSGGWRGRSGRRRWFARAGEDSQEGRQSSHDDGEFAQLETVGQPLGKRQIYSVVDDWHFEHIPPMVRLSRSGVNPNSSSSRWLNSAR